MTTNHIDQLAEWWDEAEEGEPRAGDTLIWQKPGPSYELFTADATDGGLGKHIRILARAPKPKPAWHEADYVIARADGKSRRVWANNRFMKRWEDGVSWSHADDLRDVTPLIEARVTDEMIERAWAAVSGWPANTRSVVAQALTAALGLETA